MEPFPDGDSMFLSKISHQNIKGAIASKFFVWIVNDCKDLIQCSGPSP